MHSRSLLVSASNGQVQCLDQSLFLPEIIRQPYTIEDGVRLGDFTKKISKSWSKKSKSALQSLLKIGDSKEEREKILRGLSNCLDQSPQERWNSLSSTMLCLSYTWGGDSVRYLSELAHDKAKLHITSPHRMRWDYFMILADAFDSSDMGNIFEFGALQAALRKSVQLNLIECKFPYVIPNTLWEAVLTQHHSHQALSEIAQVSPFFKQQVFENLSQLLSEWAPQEDHPEATCYALSQIYSSLIAAGITTPEDIQSELFQIAKSSSPQAASLFGQLLAIISLEFHIKSDFYEDCIEQIHSATTLHELRNALNLTAEFCLYDELTAENFIKFLSESIGEAPSTEIPFFAEAASSIVSIFNDNFVNFLSGYESLLTFISTSPLDLYADEEKKHYTLCVDSFCGITEKIDHPEDIQRATLHLLNALTKPICQSRISLYSTLQSLLARSPQNALLSITAFLDKSPLTLIGYKLLEDIIPPLITSPGIEIEQLEDLLVALGRCHCIDFYSPRESEPPQHNLLEHLRRIIACAYHIEGVPPPDEK